MLYAKTLDGVKVKASPYLKKNKIKVFCPFCDPFYETPLRHNCGTLKDPYFSHPPGNCCDAYRPETEWHRRWKKEVNKDYCEVSIIKNGYRHVADIKNKNGLVIELQHSKINETDIQNRELFYDEMVWLFDATNLRSEEKLWKQKPTTFFLECQYDPKSDLVFCKYNWKWARKWILNTKKPLFLDLDCNHIFYVANKSVSEGYGCLISKATFIDKVLKGKGLKKFPHSQSGLKRWMEQIKQDKKKEKNAIENLVTSCLEIIIQEDVDEQIFFNTLQTEINLCNENYISEIKDQEIELINSRLEKEKSTIQYSTNLSIYEPEIVYNAIINICDFITVNSVSIENKYNVCEKINYLAINFRLKIFEYLVDQKIISYSRQNHRWYVSNEEYVNELKQSKLFDLLNQKRLLQNS